MFGSTVAGLHDPLMPLPDIADKVGTDPPAHIVADVPNANVGVMFGFTVTEKVAEFAHCPASGVKV